MRKALLSTTSLLGVALLADTAAAADGIKLVVGGYFREAYLVNFDDDDENELGNERSFDGFFNDAEIHFKGSTILDNGLEVGARVELEGETNGDQIDEAWVYFGGGFGEVRIGSEDEALSNACIIPPGGTANFSAFSPNQWGANTNQLLGTFGQFSSNSVCTGVDASGDAQKLVYISPVFAGFQLTASYTPNESSENHTNNGGPHVGMTQHFVLQSRHNVSVYGTYMYEGDGWGLAAGLGASFEGHTEEGGTGADIEEQDYYQAGINLHFGNFAIGVAGEYLNDVFTIDAGPINADYDIWTAGIGASYEMDAWTFGLQYSHREDEIDDVIGAGLDLDMQQDRVVGTVNYALGPGINVDAELGYTWIDTDPEIETLGAPFSDDYQSLEIGVGTSITF
jgi:outer membrane protein OmpU